MELFIDDGELSIIDVSSDAEKVFNGQEKKERRKSKARSRKSASKDSLNDLDVEFLKFRQEMWVEKFARPYECNICGRTFCSNKQLQAHYVDHLHDKFFTTFAEISQQSSLREIDLTNSDDVRTSHPRHDSESALMTSLRNRIKVTTVPSRADQHGNNSETSRIFRVPMTPDISSIRIPVRKISNSEMCEPQKTPPIPINNSEAGQPPVTLSARPVQTSQNIQPIGLPRPVQTSQNGQPIARFPRPVQTSQNGQPIAHPPRPVQTSQNGRPIRLPARSFQTSQAGQSFKPIRPAQTSQLTRHPIAPFHAALTTPLIRIPVRPIQNAQTGQPLKIPLTPIPNSEAGQPIRLPIRPAATPNISDQVRIAVPKPCLITRPVVSQGAPRSINKIPITRQIPPLMQRLHGETELRKLRRENIEGADDIRRVPVPSLLKLLEGEEEKEKEFACYCGKVFQSQLTLSHHYETHLKDVVRTVERMSSPPPPPRKSLRAKSITLTRALINLEKEEEEDVPREPPPKKSRKSAKDDDPDFVVTLSDEASDSESELMIDVREDMRQQDHKKANKRVMLSHQVAIHEVNATANTAADSESERLIDVREELRQRDRKKANKRVTLSHQVAVHEVNATANTAAVHEVNATANTAADSESECLVDVREELRQRDRKKANKRVTLSHQVAISESAISTSVIGNAATPDNNDSGVEVPGSEASTASPLMKMRARRFVCGVCDKEFKMKKLWQVHLENEHPRDFSKQQSDGEPIDVD